MQKQPDQRYQTADAFLAALDAAVARPAVAPPIPASVPPAEVPLPIEEEGRSPWWWALIAGLVLLAGLGLYLLLGAKEKVVVPSVVGVPQAEAQLQLKRAGFGTDAQTKSSLTVALGTVIGQDPAGGDRAEKGATVTITVSSGPGTAQIPDLTGKPRSEATETLDELGFEVEEDAQSSSTITENRVIETRPAAGQTVDRGTTVTIVLSSGRPRVSVPKVVGKSLADARTELESAGFTVSVTRREDADSDPGTVLSQTPSGGANAREGSSVALVVSEEPAEVDVPDIIGSTEASATRELKAAGFTVRAQTEPVEDPTEDGLVTAQDTRGKAKPGTRITITIGRLVAPTTTETTP
jgi:serine/threonine-protein kinase